MTILGKNKLVDALDCRYQAFRKKLVDLLEGADGPKDADHVARLWKELREQFDGIEEHMGSGNQTIEDDDGNVLPRPKVGDEIAVHYMSARHCGKVVTVHHDGTVDVEYEVPGRYIDNEEGFFIQLGGAGPDELVTMSCRARPQQLADSTWQFIAMVPEKYRG